MPDAVWPLFLLERVVYTIYDCVVVVSCIQQWIYDRDPEHGPDILVGEKRRGLIIE